MINVLTQMGHEKAGITSKMILLYHCELSYCSLRTELHIQKYLLDSPAWTTALWLPWRGFAIMSVERVFFFREGGG